MGRDKALLRLGGGRLVDAVVAAVRTAGCGPVFLSGVPAGYADLDLQVLPDDVPGCGPLGGITAALAAAPGAFVFVVACDLPLLAPAVVALLAGEAAGCDGAVPAVGPEGWQPLCAVYARSLLPLARAHLRSGRLKLTDLIGAADIRAVAAEQLRRADPQLLSFTNVNTPDDLRRVRALWAARQA